MDEATEFLIGIADRFEPDLLKDGVNQGVSLASIAISLKRLADNSDIMVLQMKQATDALKVIGKHLEPEITTHTQFQQIDPGTIPDTHQFRTDKKS